MVQFEFELLKYRDSRKIKIKCRKNENLTVFEAVAADAVSYADAVLEDLDKKKIERIGIV